MEFSYSSRRGTEEPKKLCSRAPLTYTPCHYGGKRPWFVCPNLNCRRRTGKLYAGGHYFFYRHCYNLAYSSQSEITPHRLLRQIQRVRRKLGGSINVDAPFTKKPKGMQWSTYWCLRQKDREMVRLMDLAMVMQCLKWAKEIPGKECKRGKN